MTAPTLKLFSGGGAGGSAAKPAYPDNQSPIGGANQVQGGRATDGSNESTPLATTLVQVTGQTSHTAGGDAPVWTQVLDSAAEIVAVIPFGITSQGGTGYLLEYDHANGKFIVRQSNGAAVFAEVAAASNQSTRTWLVEVIHS